MITEKQIEEAAAEYAGTLDSCYTNDFYGFTSGATWMQEQKQKEIDELVTALKYANRFVDKERCDIVYIDVILSKYNEK